LNSTFKLKELTKKEERINLKRKLGESEREREREELFFLFFRFLFLQITQWLRTGWIYTDRKTKRGKKRYKKLRERIT